MEGRNLNRRVISNKIIQIITSNNCQKDSFNNGVIVCILQPNNKIQGTKFAIRMNGAHCNASALSTTSIKNAYITAVCIVKRMEKVRWMKETLSYYKSYLNNNRPL